MSKLDRMMTKLGTPDVKSAPLMLISSSEPSSGSSNELELTSNLKVIPNVVQIVEEMVHRAQFQ
jgi:hypothetical protein